MGLFSDMEKFGLGNLKNAKVLDDKTESQTQGQQNTSVMEKNIVSFNEEDVLFDKHYTCPVCDLKFTTRSIRAGKVRLLGQDVDLRPKYDKVDALKYDVITCDKCGYSALVRYFGKLSTRQMKDIKESVGSNFKGIDNDISIYSYDDAIARYKFALLCAIVKNAKNSEKAYICLKLAWVIRGKRESIGENDPLYEKLYDEEMECINNSYDAFVNSISTELFPIAGMDENTLKYIMSDMARKLGKFDESIKLLGSVITSRTTNDRLKKKALELKDMIKEDMHNNS